MSTKFEIKKLNNLVNDDSFIQVNIVNGFKYLDRQGEIISHYFNIKPRPISINPAEDGALLIKKSEDEELKLDLVKFWGHYHVSDNLGNTIDKFVNDFKAIKDILDISKINRIGWRNHFVYEFKNEEIDEVKKIIENKFYVSDDVKFSDIKLKSIINDIVFIIYVKGVVKKNEGKTIGLLFDVDSFKIYKEGDEASADKIRTELNIIKDAIYSDNFINIVNLILNK